MLHGVLSYWMLPLFSAVVWLAMLLTMLVHWLSQGKPRYESMEEGQNVAYISDVGAEEFKPLFIVMGAISVITFDMAFIAERWLRHTRRLVHNTSGWQKTLALLSIIFSIVGAGGFILLAIFDTKRHKLAHNFFISFFIGGYVVSAIFTCIEYQRLGKYFREFRILRVSFWMKLFFILVEIIVSVVFGLLNRLKFWNAGAILEWVIALIYSIYVFSFVIDFLPATRTKYHMSGQTMEEQGMARANHHGMAERGYANAGYADEHHDVRGVAPARSSRGSWFGRKQSPRGMV